MLQIVKLANYTREAFWLKEFFVHVWYVCVCVCYPPFIEFQPLVETKDMHRMLLIWLFAFKLHSRAYATVKS